MIPAIKAEFRKLLTVRSTYVIAIVAVMLVSLLAFFGEGKIGGREAALGHGNPLLLAGTLTQHAMILSVFCAITAILLITQEYRHNTITFSLTTVNSRSKVLVSKIVVVATYVLVVSIVGTFLGLAFVFAGSHAAGAGLPHQDFSLIAYLIKLIFFCEAYALAALAISVMLRNQIAALAVMFITPTTVEGLLSLVMKESANYLPFAVLQQVIIPPVSYSSFAPIGDVTPLKGAVIFMFYLIDAWIVAWILFLVRDAN